MSEQLATRTTAESPVGRETGFELVSPGQPGTANIESALARNRVFAAAGGHRGAVVFPKLRLFVITCLDPRVDPAHFFGLGLGDAIVVRNVVGADEATLREHAVLDPAKTVSHDVERLHSAPAISPRVTVSGHVYDVVTGLVETVLPAGPRGNRSVAQPQSPQGD